MKSNYSFLNDELALIEIRKHKWIESEKRGTEMGFATAAVEWIKKYGSSWKQFRSESGSKNIFNERRQYRRFGFNFPVVLKNSELTVTGTSNDFNLVGLSCQVPIFLSPGTEVEISFKLKSDKRLLPLRNQVQFKSRILRISPPREKESKACYETFIPFNEEMRDFLRSNSELIGVK